MKFFQFSILICTLLITVNAFAQQHVYADINNVNIPANWKCKITLAGYFKITPTDKGPNPDKIFDAFILNQQRTASVFTFNKTASYFVLYDRYVDPPIATADVSCLYNEEGSDVKFKLPKSCSDPIYIGKKIYLTGKIEGDDPKKFQFKNINCSIQ